MFLVCGEALFDVFLDPVAGAGPRTLTATPGGSPFNVAIGLARLGRAAGFCTSLSADALGRRLEALLTEEGVDVSTLRRLDGPTPLALVEVDDAGQPRYGFHGLRELPVDPTATPPDLDGVHVGSVPIVSPVSAGPLLALMAEVGAERLTTFDPNVRLAVEPDAAFWRAQVDRFRARARVIKVGDDDLRALYGQSVDPEQVAAGWLGGRTALVVLTRGADGLVLFGAEGGRVAVPAGPARVIDTVGAGDSVQAAVIAWLQEHGADRPDRLAALGVDDLRSMGTFAAAAAALTCSRRGPDLPRRSELA